jgi:hypothetical protein
VSGTWNFKTTTSDYPSFTLVIHQSGTHLAGAGPMVGVIHGQALAFEVLGVAVEDFFGGQGIVDASGTHMAGNFQDGFGAVGKFVATKVS